jgi:hypothetical protein
VKNVAALAFFRQMQGPPSGHHGAMLTVQSPSSPAEASLLVGDIVEARGEEPLMFVLEVLADRVRCAWVHLHGVREGVFPLAALRRAPAPGAAPPARAEG